MGGKAILVVDDEEIIRLSLLNILKKKEFEVDIAESGEEAMNKISLRRYDLVITDLMMDNGNGIDVIMKARESHPDIPILIITGYGASPIFDEAMSLGPFGYLVKPFSKDEICAKVAHCLGV